MTCMKKAAQPFWNLEFMDDRERRAIREWLYVLLCPTGTRRRDTAGMHDERGEYTVYALRATMTTTKPNSMIVGTVVRNEKVWNRGHRPHSNTGGTILVASSLLWYHPRRASSTEARTNRCRKIKFWVVVILEILLYIYIKFYPT
jgi:hypothetical protein